MTDNLKNNLQQLGLKLQEWHECGNDPVYAVGSSLFAGHDLLSLNQQLIDDCIFNLERSANQERTANRLDNVAELNGLILALRSAVDSALIAHLDGESRRYIAFGGAVQNVPNIDLRSGVRYGVLHQNEISIEALDEDIYGGHSTDLVYQEYRDGKIRELQSIISRWTEQQNKPVRDYRFDDMCADIDKLANDFNRDADLIVETAQMITSGQYDAAMVFKGSGLEQAMNDHYDSDCSRYLVEDGDLSYLYSNDSGYVTVLKSKFYSLTRLCSPCFPNAGDASAEGQFKTYTLPPEYFYYYDPEVGTEQSQCPLTIFDSETNRIARLSAPLEQFALSELKETGLKAFLKNHGKLNQFLLDNQDHFNRLARSFELLLNDDWKADDYEDRLLVLLLSHDRIDLGKLTAAAEQD